MREQTGDSAAGRVDGRTWAVYAGAGDVATRFKWRGHIRPRRRKGPHVAKKRQPYQQKIRTREHIIGDLAINHAERQGLLCGFSLERILHDYGLDLILFTYNSGGELEDGCIFLQVKATERTRPLRGQ